MSIKDQKIGLIGTGLMGSPIAARLAKSGFNVAVFNRTAEKAEQLASDHISVAADLSSLLTDCSTVLLTLSDAAAIQNLLIENSDLAFSNNTIIQMGTISPEQSRALSDKFMARGADYFEAPVLGSIPEATEGKLIVMVGSTPSQFADYQAIFAALGSEIVHVGGIGTAAALKLAMNQLIGALTTAFSVSLGYVQAQQVPVDSFMSVVRASALYAKTYDKKLSRMLDRDFSKPNFPTKHLLKDMELLKTSAEPAGISIQSLAGIIDIIKRAVDMGLAETDYSALFQAVYDR